MYSQSSFWCSQMGSAFLAMNSSTGMPSINCGRGTRFCLPLMKTIMFVSCPLRFVEVLRRRFAHSLDDARVGDSWDGLLDPVDVDLMKPVVAEVEPVTEDTTRLQIQVIHFGRTCVPLSPLLAFARTGDAVIGSLGIEGT